MTPHPEFGFELCCSDTVFIGEVLFSVDGFLFLHDVIEALIAHDDRIHDGISVVLEVVLLQNGKSLTGCEHDVSVRGFEFTREDL